MGCSPLCAEISQATFERAMQTATEATLGETGTSLLGTQVLEYDGTTGLGTLQVARGQQVQLRAALTLLANYQGRRVAQPPPPPPPAASTYARPRNLPRPAPVALLIVLTH